MPPAMFHGSRYFRSDEFRDEQGIPEPGARHLRIEWDERVAENDKQKATCNAARVRTV